MSNLIGRVSQSSSLSGNTVESYYSWLVVILSLVIASLSFGAVTAIPILMQPMVEDLGWMRSTLGLAHALAMVGAGAMGMVIGYLADRWSFALLSILAGLASGIGLWLSSKASVPWHMYASYAILVGALGQGALFGPITANVSHWFDRNRALAMAIVLCGQSVGGLTVPIALRSFAEAWGWREAMATYGIVCSATIVTCSLVFLRVPPSRFNVSSGSLSQVGHFTTLQKQTFLLVSGALFLHNMGSFIVIAHLVAFGEEQGFSPELGASLLAVLLGVTLFSRIFGGYLIDKHRHRLVLLICTIFTAAGALILSLGAGIFPLMIIGAMTFGLGYGGVIPGFVSIIRSTFPNSVAGTWISAMFMFGFFAAASGSWMGGLMRDKTGDYLSPFLLSCALTLISFLLVLKFVRSSSCANQGPLQYGSTLE